jgi:general secretion pathway protein C
MALSDRLPVPRVLQLFGLGAACAGLIVGWTLWSSAAASLAPVPREDAPAPVESPVAQWFDNVPAPLEIKVSGLLATAHGAVAILAINDAPPRAFLAGERLAQGVKLINIEAAAIVIERGGAQSRLPISRLLEILALPPLLRQ